MKTITLTAWKRPALLREVVDSLKQNDTSGYSLLAVLDDGYDPACYDILHSIGFMPKHAAILTTHHGVHYAGKFALQTALRFGSDFNFAMEDDTRLSPDCLDLVNAWEGSRLRGVLNCFSFSRGEQDARLVKKTGEFNAWGWAANRGMINLLLNRWSAELGWDTSIRKFFEEVGVKTWQPALSRVTNIGPVGSHYTPVLHAEHFGGCVASIEKPSLPYVFA